MTYSVSYDREEVRGIYIYIYIDILKFTKPVHGGMFILKEDFTRRFLFCLVILL